MSPFEYVIVLISIILGLGITTILTGIAELIKHTTPVKLFAPYIIWIALIFLLHFQDWWLSYQLMAVKEWSLQFFLMIVLYPINLYILAHLLFPADLAQGFDSKEFFLQHFPRLFIGALILIALSVIQNIALSHLPWWTQVPHGVAFTILLAMVMNRTRSHVGHVCVAVGLLVLMVVGFVIDQDNLVIH
jgi:hypothetical protein